MFYSTRLKFDNTQSTKGGALEEIKSVINEDTLYLKP